MTNHMSSEAKVECFYRYCVEREGVPLDILRRNGEEEVRKALERVAWEKEGWLMKGEKREGVLMFCLLKFVLCVFSNL